MFLFFTLQWKQAPGNTNVTPALANQEGAPLKMANSPNPQVRAHECVQRNHLHLGRLSLKQGLVE